LRILHFVPNFYSPTGGRDGFVWGLVNHLQKYNVDQFVVTNDNRNTGQQPATAKKANVVIFSLKVKRIGNYWMLEGLSKILKETKCDIINIHGYGEYPADLSCILKRMGLLVTPLVLATHGISGLKHGFLAFKPSFPLTPRERIIRISHLFYDFTLGRLEMRTFDKVIILSDEEKHYLSRIGLEEKKIVNIPIAIEDVFFRKESYSPERKYILYTGRIDRYKGLEVLLRAIKGLKAANTKTMCLIIGRDVGYKSKVQSLVNEFGIADLVQIKDQVSKEELVGIYSSALVTVLPSLSEAFPLTLVESMARGTPFISTPVGSIPELVSRTKAGMIVPIGDTDCLTKTLLYLLCHNKAWHDLSENGKIFAQNYRWDIIGRKYYQLYTTLIEEFAKKEMTNIRN
jgi:glycosyltransferase involved in cell wall biosynthesis